MMRAMDWWPNDEEQAPKREDLCACLPTRTNTGLVKRLLGEDPVPLNVGDSIAFLPTKLCVERDTPTSYRELRDWPRLEGVVLCAVAIGPGDCMYLGSAVLVAPGVALSASHIFRGRDMRHPVSLFGHSKHGSMKWEATHFRHIDSTDLCIVSLRLVGGSPTIACSAKRASPHDYRESASDLVPLGSRATWRQLQDCHRVTQLAPASL